MSEGIMVWIKGYPSFRIMKKQYAQNRNASEAIQQFNSLLTHQLNLIKVNILPFYQIYIDPGN